MHIIYEDRQKPVEWVQRRVQLVGQVRKQLRELLCEKITEYSLKNEIKSECWHIYVTIRKGGEKAEKRRKKGGEKAEKKRRKGGEKRRKIRQIPTGKCRRTWSVWASTMFNVKYPGRRYSAIATRHQNESSSFRNSSATAAKRFIPWEKW